MSVINNRLLLFDVQSIKSAYQMKELFESLSCNFIEFAAGRGMISSALLEVGLKVYHVTDINDFFSFSGGINIRKENAITTIVGNLHLNPLYFSCFIPDGLLAEIINYKPEIKCLMFVSSGTELLSVKYEKVQMLPVKIPHFNYLYNESETLILGINMSKEEFESRISKLPSKFLIQT